MPRLTAEVARGIRSLLDGERGDAELAQEYLYALCDWFEQYQKPRCECGGRSASTRKAVRTPRGRGGAADEDEGAWRRDRTRGGRCDG